MKVKHLIGFLSLFLMINVLAGGFAESHPTEGYEIGNELFHADFDYVGNDVVKVSDQHTTDYKREALATHYVIRVNKVCYGTSPPNELPNILFRHKTKGKKKARDSL